MGTKTYKIAGQSAPAANAQSQLYVVPLLTQFVQSTLTVCNRNLNDIGRYSVAVVPAGQSLSAQHYLVFEKGLDARDSKFLTLGLSIGPGDQVIVQASSADFSFSLFGVEITV